MSLSLRQQIEARCIHFNGVQNEKCLAGIDYKSFQCGLPCLKYMNRDAKCEKRQEPTEEQIKTELAEYESMDGAIDRINVAREAILQELRRRWKEGPIPVGVTAPRDISRFHKPQSNYFCGAGVMQCPICRTGKLKYSRSTYNGHVHARCSTDGCVAWME